MDIKEFERREESKPIQIWSTSDFVKQLDYLAKAMGVSRSKAARFIVAEKYEAVRTEEKRNASKK